MNTRITTVEHLSEGMEAQRTVILGVAAVIVGLVVIGFYTIVNIDNGMQNRLKAIETKIGVAK
jgi:hypothetical protein